MKGCLCISKQSLKNYIESKIKWSLGRKEIRYESLTWWILLEKLVECLFSFHNFDWPEIIQVDAAHKTVLWGDNSFGPWLLHFFIRRFSKIHIFNHILEVCFTGLIASFFILSRALSSLITRTFIFTIRGFLYLQHIKIGILLWTTSLFFTFFLFLQSFSYLI
jgi:hypothetical protein